MVRKMTRDPVAAQKEGSALVDVDRFHIDLDRRLGAQCATDHVLAGMVSGLFRSHPAGPHFFLNNRMIFRFADELAGWLKAIKTRIADVADRGFKALNVERHHRSG